MSLNTKRVLLVAAVIAVASVASGCELTLPAADCSFVNQPDMGGLVCFGASILSVAGGALALVLALLLGLGGAIPT